METVFANPFLERPGNTLYLNALKFPWGANYDAPEKYGLAPNKTYNFKIHTSDNETLGAWFVLSDALYQTIPFPPSAPDLYIPEALRQFPTILFLHGNAGTRAFGARIQHYTAFSARMHANVLAIDYRGFAESSGSPSEDGLVCDARAAWEWLISQGARGEDILIVGHSLGTGVGARLAAELSDENVPYRGVVLMSPFSSIGELLKTYNLFGAVPLMKPLAMIPYATNIVTWALIHKFDTLSVVPRIKGEVVIVHAENDWDIPYTHSEVLFNAFLEPHLPSVKLPKNPASLSKDEWSEFTSQLARRKDRREELVTQTELKHLGSISEFTDGKRDITFIKLAEGGHDYVGVQEGLQDIIGTKYGFMRDRRYIEN
ncbi:abhydrolase domain-containing 12 [Hymenopellis radicata]|nr:abhydrolase domain-containing 12 [Hymenopellis radicata]